MVIFTILTLPIHEHGVVFPFFQSLYLFFRDLMFTVKVVTSFIRFVPRCLIIFEAIVSGSVSVVVVEKAIHSLLCYVAKFVYHFQKSSGGILGLSNIQCRVIWEWGGCTAFLISIPFIFFYCRTTPANASGTVLKRNTDSAQPCLPLTAVGLLQTFLQSE